MVVLPAILKEIALETWRVKQKAINQFLFTHFLCNIFFFSENIILQGWNIVEKLSNLISTQLLMDHRFLFIHLFAKSFYFNFGPFLRPTEINDRVSNSVVIHQGA